ncbi:hypothetical protein [Actinoallomurus soli]|uniref:hypothetical protein n=1 Tax=Actinoallomurus soli TaxID=2952535 RepID=UPI0020939E08|nr:hypothetical protein [Actinoallomurus soli]MCO5968279.1 hypothetical protein [Actinoallomurus soli]
MVPRWSRSRRCTSAAPRRPGLRALARRLHGLLARPATRRLLTMAGIAVAGWMFGATGQAHADTVPGARLPSVVAHAGSQVTRLPGDLPPLRAAVPAVHVPRTALRHSHPPLIPVSPAPAAGGSAGAVRPGTSEVTADPSRAPRHSGHGHRVAAGRGPVTSTGPVAATGASEKVSVDHATRSRVPAPVMPRMPQQLPHRAQALLPSIGDGVTQTGLWRAPGFGAASGRSRASALIVRTVPPAVRTAADEPSFSPD